MAIMKIISRKREPTFRHKEIYQATLGVSILRLNNSIINIKGIPRDVRGSPVNGPDVSLTIKIYYYAKTIAGELLNNQLSPNFLCVCLCFLFLLLSTRKNYYDLHFLHLEYKNIILLFWEPELLLLLRLWKGREKYAKMFFFYFYTKPQSLKNEELIADIYDEISFSCTPALIYDAKLDH
jgi:hypothetical protein